MMKAAPLPATILFVLSLALNLWFEGAPDWRWIPAALAPGTSRTCYRA